MIGRYRGFSSGLKKKICLLCTACFTVSIWWQSILVHHVQESLGNAVKAINKIKANAKNDRLFRQLCEANDEVFERLLLHTEVR